MKKIQKYMKNPNLIIQYLASKGFFNSLNDEDYIKLMYKIKIGKKINLDKPQSYNEKLQCLKLYDRNPLYTKLVDKYEVKEYIEKKVGKEYIVPTIGIYEKFEDIKFDELPNKFVLKCTHDSGGLVICKNKEEFNKDDAEKKIKKALKRNYFYSGREWPYKNVKPRILVEKYMEDTKTKELMDYKFFCFNGKVEFFKIDFDRFKEHRANYFDVQRNLLPFGEIICPPDYNKKIEFPKELDKMIKLATTLSTEIPFVRVDFYSVDNKIYFGEMTLFPASGFGKFEPEEWDYKIGDLLKLPAEKRENNEK